MSQNNLVRTLYIGFSVLFILLITSSCSNKKNTALTRFYHSVNTRYNIHYNADIAYKEALEAKEKGREDNLSQLVYIFPKSMDSLGASSGSFTTTIDKTTKAIKLHSITAKPKRDPDRRNDAEYQAWIRQKEYTPFMDQVWLLLAKAEFQDGNYLQAVSTFLYITKIYSTNPEIVAECQLWIARAYTEMGWLYEAGDILHKIEIAGGAPEKHKGFYALVKANYLVYNNEYEAAIPQLEIAIKNEHNKHQKTRMKYLLGQLYAQLGDKTKADKAFSSVKGMSTPYKYTFNAQLRQIELDDSPAKTKALSMLSGMSKKTRNKEYLDQIYTTLGDIYLEKTDTLKALANYKKGVKESVRNGYDKAMAQIRLGDLYFLKRKFVLAQPCYSEALPQLNKSHHDYPKVALRSSVLDELVVHVKVVEEQDSLQYIAQLPEEERLRIIKDKIEQLKKEEAKRQREEETQKRIEERQERISSWDDINEQLFDQSNKTSVAPPVITQQGAAIFYFYNEQAVNQGKIAFQQQWGNRKLEDDWRRRNKRSTGIFDEVDTAQEPDSLDTEAHRIKELQAQNEELNRPKSAVDDEYSVEYYLQQLPLTPEAIKESNVLIEDALYKMGLIYKDKLQDMDLAIDAFNTNIHRFPNTPNLQEIYYQLFLIYMRLGDNNMMATYRSKLMNEFASGKYAGPVSQPDYEWNFRNMASLQDSLYNEAYKAYQQADVETVRRNYAAMNTKYPFTDLMPNFTLLNALTYAQVRDAGNLETSLTDLVKKYPKSDITPLASDILERLKSGKILLSDGSPVTGFDWSKAYQGADSLLASKGKILQYSDTLDVPYVLMLMFKPKTIDRNELLYQVADYNFTNYVIQTFDLSFDTDPPYEVLQMKGFNSFAAIRSYLSKAYSKEGLIQHLDKAILAVPISTDNYINLLPRLGLERYMAYFSEHFSEQFPQLIASWSGDKYVESAQPVEIAEVVGAKEESKAEELDEAVKQPVTIPQTPVVLEKPVQKQPETKVNDKQITGDDLLSKDQLQKAGEVNKVIDDISNVVSNPVDGIKSLFDRYKNSEKLTKEEKQALKEEEKLRKEEEKRQKAIEKIRLDSINKIEKARTDSIANVENALEDSIKAANKQAEEEKRLEEQQKEDAAKAAVKAREDARKQKEADRKQKEREQKERLRQREKERKEKEKVKEQERKQKEREAEERRKQRLKEKR